MTKIFLKLRRRFYYLLLSLTRYWEGRLGIKCRYLIYKRFCKSCGTGIHIASSVFIQDVEKLELGDNISIHEFSLISCEGGLKIGNDVSIAHNCSILTTSHIYDNPDIKVRDSGVINCPVEIGDNVWIGCGCRILGGAEIGSGVILGANSVAIGILADDNVYVGAPAKAKKSRVKN